MSFTTNVCECFFTMFMVPIYWCPAGGAQLMNCAPVNLMCVVLATCPVSTHSSRERPSRADKWLSFLTGLGVGLLDSYSAVRPRRWLSYNHHCLFVFEIWPPFRFLLVHLVVWWRHSNICCRVEFSVYLIVLGQNITCLLGDIPWI